MERDCYMANKRICSFCNSEIDIDNLTQAMHSAFKEAKTVELMGIRFDERDLEALESYIKKLS